MSCFKLTSFKKLMTGKESEMNDLDLVTNRTRSIEEAHKLTKEFLLRRMRAYISHEASIRKIPEWSVVGKVFGTGSNVSCALWDEFINGDPTPAPTKGE